MALAALYFAFPGGSAGGAVIFIGIGIGSSLAMLAGVVRNRPEARLPWLLIVAGNGLFATGDLIARVWTSSSVPAPDDVVYLTGYPLVAGGLVLLVLSVGLHHRLAALADAGIVTLAFAVFQWIWVMAPAIQHGGNSLTQRIVYGLYPAMDVVLLAGFTGFFVSPAWRTPAFRFLAAGAVMLLLGDEVFGLTSSTYANGHAVDLAWMLSYLFWAAAALHPSMRDLSRPRRLPALRVSAYRLTALAAALLVVPTVLLVQRSRHKGIDLYEVVALSSGISLLVVARLTGILRALERIRLRERAARAEAEFARKLLAEQNERLVEADRLKDEFVALISHDLRTPLTSIIGYVELALDESAEAPLDDERRSYLEIVARSSDRLLRLVDDLLFVARLQTGRLLLTRDTVDLTDVGKLAVEEARARAERKGLTISFLATGPVFVEADRGRLFQLLDNLVGNAIKFTSEGGRIDVRAVNSPSSGVLEVSDTGIGLGADGERVFDRFFRASNAIEQQIPGTGLGLFIARAIAEAHDGAISASARDGGGTTFRVELPASVPSLTATARSAVSSSRDLSRRA
ncbi:MAG: sensor histidine kinase [Gaiellaceae bacterium]